MPDIFVHFVEMTAPQEKEIAQGITDIFCELAGCKPQSLAIRFVKESYYAGGEQIADFGVGVNPTKQPNFRIDVQLFPGRPPELKQKITDKLGAMVEKTIGVPADKVEMHTSDLHNQNLFIAGGVDWIPAPQQS